LYKYKELILIKYSTKHVFWFCFSNLSAILWTPVPWTLGNPDQNDLFLLQNYLFHSSNIYIVSKGIYILNKTILFWIFLLLKLQILWSSKYFISFRIVFTIAAEFFHETFLYFKTLSGCNDNIKKRIKKILKLSPVLIYFLSK